MSLSELSFRDILLFGLLLLANLALANVARIVGRFHEDYRKVNRLDEREQHESFP
jgi:hypothetical protein